MRRLALALTLIPAAVSAHPGHVETVAGHDHWAAVLLAGAAALVALAAWASRRPAPRRDERAKDRA